MSQELLFRPDPIADFPIDDQWYVPVIQNRNGELDALHRTSARAWRRMMPLVVLIGPTGKEKDDEFGDLDAKGIRRRIARIGHGVQSYPIYLDVLRLQPTKVIESESGSQPLLQNIYRCGLEIKRRLEVWLGPGGCGCDVLRCAARR